MFHCKEICFLNWITPGDWDHVEAEPSPTAGRTSGRWGDVPPALLGRHRDPQVLLEVSAAPKFQVGFCSLTCL